MYLVGNPKSSSIGLYSGLLYESSEVFENAILKTAKGEISLTEPFEDEFGEWIAVLYPIRLNGEVVVVYGFDFDYKNFSSEIRKSLSTISLVIILVGIVLNLSIFVYIHTSIRPLVYLAKDVYKFSLEESFSNLKFSLDYQKEDEIGILYKSFHHLISTLQKYLEDLNHNVKQQKNISEQVAESASQIQVSLNSIEEESNLINYKTSENEKVLNQFSEIVEQNYKLIGNIKTYFSEVSNFTQSSKEQVEKGT